MIFKINLATHSLATLVNFNSPNGANPYGTVTLDGNGSLYATAPHRRHVYQRHALFAHAP